MNTVRRANVPPLANRHAVHFQYHFSSGHNPFTCSVKKNCSCETYKTTSATSEEMTTPSFILTGFAHCRQVTNFFIKPANTAFVWYCMRATVHVRGCLSFKNRPTDNSKNNSKFIMYIWRRLFFFYGHSNWFIYFPSLLVSKLLSPGTSVLPLVTLEVLGEQTTLSHGFNVTHEILR